MTKRANENFNIGELAKRASVSIQTIRFYERQGILNPIARRDSGYRAYNSDSVKRLKFIRQAKGLGFTLREINDLMGLRIRSVESCNKVRAKATRKMEEVRQKIERLKDLEKTLKELVQDCENRVVSDCCPILEKMEI